jgi:hypothetical protein
VDSEGKWRRVELELEVLVDRESQRERGEDGSAGEDKVSDGPSERGCARCEGGAKISRVFNVPVNVSGILSGYMYIDVVASLPT